MKTKQGLESGIYFRPTKRDSRMGNQGKPFVVITIFPTTISVSVLCSKGSVRKYLTLRPFSIFSFFS